MRAFVENFFAVTAVLGFEAWFLKGYFAGQPEFEPAIGLLIAVGTLLAKDPIRARLARTEPSVTHDTALFNEFLQVLPYDPAIRMLRDQDFSDSFDKRSLRQLFDFAWLWESVEKEFIDQELEAARKLLHEAATAFRQEVAGRTVPIRVDGFVSVESDNLRRDGHPRHPDVVEDGRILNELADPLAAQYESFVRLCKSKLAQ